MNNLTVFNNEEFGEIRTITVDGKVEIVVFDTLIDRFKLLSIACNSPSKEYAWEIMNVASKLFHPLNDDVFNTLYGAVAMELTRGFKKNEFYYHELFYKNYSKIRKGKVIKNKSDGRNIPDAWVEKNGYIIPVEIKLKDFDKKALSQLKRYMATYSSRRGIAVAERASIDLPSDIEFISIKELEKVNE